MLRVVNDDIDRAEHGRLPLSFPSAPVTIVDMVQIVGYATQRWGVAAASAVLQ